MNISHEHLLTLQGLRGFGPKKIEVIAAALIASSFKSVSLQELFDLIGELWNAGELKGLSALPEFGDLETAEREARRIIERSESQGIGIVSRYDAAFPVNLLKTVNENGKADVPVLLYYKGDLSVTEKPALAIIGTREPSFQGVKAGETLGEYYASEGFNIVSGLAIGCDTAGHKGALAAKGGVTTAFLAHGLDTVYPAENERLAADIVSRGGLLMSEYKIGEHVNRNYLVNRDRLQAALADATIVIQTDVKGGTMHAVNATLAAGKTVYAVEYKVPIPNRRDAGNQMLVSGGRALPLRYENRGALLGITRKDAVEIAQEPSMSLKEDLPIKEETYSQGTLF